MTSLTVHSSSTADPRKAWASLDRMTLWAVGQLEQAPTERVAELLPEGILYRHIELTLAGLVGDGLLQERRSSVRTLGENAISGSTIYTTTAAGRAQLAARTTKAA
jgi:hypothetical protein